MALTGMQTVPQPSVRNVERDRNILLFHNLSSTFTVGDLILSIHDGSQRGYEDFILDFSLVQAVFPNVCAPLSGILEFYRDLRGFTFECRNIPDFLDRTKTLNPAAMHPDNSPRFSPLNTVWKFSSPEEISSLIDSYLKFVERSAVCQPGVIQGLEWCLNEVMDNVLQHSNVSHGYAMAQIHNTRQHIAICIYDYGQGIYNSLRNSQHAPQNAVDAITIALREGVTRDKRIGQGNGMWGLHNIVRANSGLLNITSGHGFFGMRPADETVTSTSVPFLSHDNNATTVDFQLDFDKGISVPGALGGYQPTNFRIEKLEDDANNVSYKLIDKASGTGTRRSGAALRNEVVNISNQTDNVIVLDFNGVSIVSSSFADEFIGKLAVDFGFIAFTQRFRLVGMNEVVQAIVNRSVAQRFGTS